MQVPDERSRPGGGGSRQGNADGRREASRRGNAKSSPTGRLTAALKRHGSTSRDGSNWTCPAHDDRRPSLSVSEGGDGRALVYCQAGCELDEVLAALGLTIADIFPTGRTVKRQNLGPIVESYDYVDETGELLFRVLRYEPPGETKTFRQRRADGTWGLGNVRRVLYSLPEVIDAVERGETVYVVEGEKDVNALWETGYTATCNPGGAGKWRPEFSEFLCGADVVIVADKDESGRRHARAVHDSLVDVAKSIRVVEAVEGKDVADHLAAGRSVGDLVAVDIESLPEAQAGTEHEEDKREKLRDAVLAHVESRGLELFHDADGRAFALVPVGDHVETLDVRSRDMLRWLSHESYQRGGEAAPKAVLEEVRFALEARAQFAGPQRDAHVRLAAYEGALYLDLADPDWRVVEITRKGWSVRPAAEVPVRFRRARGMLTLPAPESGGSVDELRAFVNVASDDDWTLLVGWLVGTLRPRGPFPVLALYGVQGAAKSTTARLLRSLVDPSSSLLRAEPREVRDLVIAARNSWIPTFDNVSRLQPWLSDSLCRLATGGGFATRELYSDADEAIFDVQRPAIITAISEVVVRGDLLDRAVVLTLPRIDEKNRRPEAELMREFDRARPRILGALLDAVSCALRRDGRVTFKHLPRMADFALWVAQAAPALGWTRQQHARVFDRARRAHVDVVLDASAIAEPLRKLLAKQKAHRSGAWEGTAERLRSALCDDKLSDPDLRKLRTWPKTARGLTAELDRITPALREAGIVVERYRGTGRDRLRLLRITQERQR